MDIIEVKKESDRFVLEVSRQEFLMLIAGLRETDEQISESEFQERIGHSRHDVNVLLEDLSDAWKRVVLGDIGLDEIKW